MCKKYNLGVEKINVDIHREIFEHKIELSSLKANYYNHISEAFYLNVLCNRNSHLCFIVERI